MIFRIINRLMNYPTDALNTAEKRYGSATGYVASSQQTLTTILLLLFYNTVLLFHFGCTYTRFQNIHQILFQSVEQATAVMFFMKIMVQ